MKEKLKTSKLVQTFLVFFKLFTGLQNRCGSIFALLAKAACTEPAISKLRRTKDVLRLKLQNRATNIHTSHALSMEVLLGRGLELGSHGSDCWPHVFT